MTDNTEQGFLPRREVDPENEAKSLKADLLNQAEDTIVNAIEEYRGSLATDPVLDATAITYSPSSALNDNHRYAIDAVNTGIPFRNDGVFQSARDAELPELQVMLLSLSPHWEDRIRALTLRESLRNEIVLPDGFPCIYEPADSPRQADSLRPTHHVWVKSPDEEMLHELLPLYQELWTAYENQWPHSPNRVFAVGRLNDVSPRGVYRPGTTPEQVIASTMLTHAGMHRTAPAHLRAMHPFHGNRATAPATTTQPKEVTP